MSRLFRAFAYMIATLFLCGCTSSCGGDVAGYGMQVGTREGVFQPAGDKAPYAATMPYVEFHGPSSTSSSQQLRTQSAAAGGTLEACQAMDLSKELLAGARPGAIMTVNGVTITVSDNNAATVMAFYTNRTPSSVAKAMKTLLVSKGFAVISSSTTDPANSLNQAVGATYTIAFPEGRKPYKAITFHLWGLDGSYTYSVYDHAGTMVYDPPGKNVTFSIPEKIVPQAGKIVLKVSGSHAFALEASC